MSKEKENIKKETTTTDSYFLPAQGEITLRKPIHILGTPTNTFKYDMDEIGWDLQDEIEQRYKMARKNDDASSQATQKFQPLFFRLTGIAAIVAVNPDLTMDDFRQLKGRDLDKVQRIGESFLIAPEDALYPENGSDPSDDGTEEPSEQQ